MPGHLWPNHYMTAVTLNTLLSGIKESEIRLHKSEKLKERGIKLIS